MRKTEVILLSVSTFLGGLVLGLFITPIKRDRKLEITAETLIIIVVVIMKIRMNYHSLRIGKDKNKGDALTNHCKGSPLFI